MNRSAVLRRLFLAGPMNRVALAQLTGLSSGSVTNVTAALLAENLIVEVGLEESDGGRPSVLLEINPDFGAVIGVDVGETGFRVEAFDLKMTEIGGRSIPLHPQDHGPEVAVDHIVEAVQSLKLEFADEGRRLLGLGIALPGIVARDGEAARVHAPNIGWHDVPLERLLGERVRVPVLVENGAKTLGQAEMWLGAGRGAEHAIVTLWGTGVGAAIFTNAGLYRGAASSAGEWGHASIVAGGKRCRCGGAGCLEAYIGARPLLEEWRRRDTRAEVFDPDDEGWVDELLAEAGGDGPGAELLDETATYFGVAAANLANLFNPERIVVGGWLGLKVGPVLLPRIRDVVRTQALDYSASRVSIELGELGADAVALGASTLVVEQLLASGGAAPKLTPI